MVDSKAEEDDEEGFGDFTFASSFSTSTLHYDQMNGIKSTILNGDDDDWGDFVESPLQSTALVSSKPSHPFGFFSDQSQLTTESASTRAESEQTRWVKPKGALPLSLFGDVEQEEEESVVVDSVFKNSVESNSERISNLYSKVQPIKAENGFDSDSNGSDPNVIVKTPILNGAGPLGMDSILDLFAGNDDIQSPQIDTVIEVSLNKDLFSGGNNVESQQIKAVSGLNSDSNWFGGQQIKGVSGLNSYSSGVNLNVDLFSGSIGFDEISDVYGQDQLNNFETSNGLSTSSPVLVGMDSYSGPLGESEELDGDYDGWEFKDAYTDSKAGVGSDKVSGKDEGNFVVGLSFEFGNRSHGSDLFPSSNGFSVEPREVDRSFDIKPLTLSQNGFSSNSFLKIEQNGTENGSNSDHAVGTVEPDESFGDFEGASTETGLNQEACGKDEGNFGVTGLSFEFGNGSHGSDLFSYSNGFSAQPREVGISFDFKPLTVAQNGFSPDPFFTREQHGTENGLNSDPAVGIVESDESFGDFEGAFTETGSNQEGNETMSNNHKGALPLSIFGDEELETDDFPNVQDAFTVEPSYPRNGIDHQGSNISINDLISNLYSQAEQVPPVESAEKHTGNGLDTLDEVMDLSLINSDDDFEDASWDFKDASIQTSTIDQTSLLIQRDTCDSFTTNLKMINFVDFYCKLKDELSVVCRGHLDNLMRAKHAAALSGEDAKAAAIDKEIKEACKELYKENIYPKECSEDELPRDLSLKEFIEVSQLKFQVLESEYGLSGRLHLAEQDLGSAVELMKHTTSMLEVLTVGSMEDQGTYVSTWSKMISVCAQELKHGSWIWKQLVEKNIQSEILSEPRGKGFILALGEIYRVVAVLGASTKLYKPWILSSSIGCTSIYDRLEECYTLWSTSGIEEALQDISYPIDFEYHSTVKALRESIRFIHGHDELTLRNHIVNQQVSVCRLSLLTSEAVPDIKMVLWNGKYYFLPLANLWANLISCDPPELPYLDVGS